MMMTRPLHVAVVDDDLEMVQVVTDLLNDEGYRVSRFQSAVEALVRFKSDPPQILITDHRMNEVDGLMFLRKVRADYPAMVSVMMTAFGSIDTAIEAMRSGAYHYLVKPFRNDDLHRIVREASREAAGPGRVPARAARGDGFGQIVGMSPAIAAIDRTIRVVASAQATVLILGESGSGKELVARALHSCSARAAKPFIAVNCTALPEQLLESELFGHVKGSFTGAVTDKKGLFEEAGEGTLFLDEVGDMPPALQAKLLRVFQERLIRPVGGTRMKPMNARIVAATHRNLKQMVGENRFREDLFYRLNVIPIHVPPLRERVQDIPLLVDHFLRASAARNGTRLPRLEADALRMLVTHAWPGNVRELENVIERAIVLSGGEIIGKDAILLGAPEGDASSLDRLAGDRPSLAVLEDRYIRRVMKDVGYNKVEAARILGVSRRTLYRRERFIDGPPSEFPENPRDQAR